MSYADTEAMSAMMFSFESDVQCR